MHVVVAGGGFCGAFIAKKLDNVPGICTTLIEEKSFFEYPPSLHKVITNATVLQKIRVPFASFLSNTTIISESITKVQANRIFTRNNEIAFDILVLCTGIKYPIFLKNSSDVYVLKSGSDALAIAQKITKANTILVVGGGVIGVEIAGEIVTKTPDKHLLIVHSQSRLIERNKNDASDYAKQFLTKNGAEIIFNEKIVSHMDTEYITDKGRKINADLCLWCAGIQWDASFMKDFPDSCFSQRHALKVNDFLQLQDFPFIFVGGDLTDISEEKTARKAELHAKIIAKNILRIKKGKKLHPYKTKTSPQVISLGDYQGILQYKIVIPGVFIIGLLKKTIEWWTLHTLKK